MQTISQVGKVKNESSISSQEIGISNKQRNFLSNNIWCKLDDSLGQKFSVAIFPFWTKPPHRKIQNLVVTFT